MQSVVYSELFRAITTAPPGDVWAALTATGSPLGYLYGLTTESDWRPGSTLTATLGQWRLVGEVLLVDRPHKLYYTLGDQAGEPSIYVSWEIRRLNDATLIRLTVDEPWPYVRDADQLEAAWLPVLSGLVAQLGVHPGTARQERGRPDG